MRERSYAFGDFVFDARQMLLLKRGSPVAIGHKCALLLESLLAAAGKPVSKTKLIEAAWQDASVEENNLAVQVAALRRCLGRAPSGRDWIATVHRFGYQLIDAEARTPQEVDRPADDRPDPDLNRLTIVVLPFVSADADAQQQHFSEALAEDITTELSRFTTLTVVSDRSTLAAILNGSHDAWSSSTTAAQFWIEGSVRFAGNRARIGVRLVEAGSARHVWAERFEVDEDGLADVTSQLVPAIVGTAVGQVHSFATQAANRKSTANLTVRDCLLRGSMLSFDDHDAASEARMLFNKAIERDSGCGRAYALLADLTYVEWWNEIGSSKIKLHDALRLAQKAVALDENDYTCQGVLGWALMFCREHDLAEQHHLRAYRLNRNRPSALAGLGGLYAYQGRRAEGLAYFDRARCLDPYFSRNWYWRTLGVIHFSERRYDKAIAAFSWPSVLPFWGHAYLAACHALSSRPKEAGRHMEATVRLAPGFSLELFASKEPYKQRADSDHLVEGLSAAGLPK